MEGEEPSVKKPLGCIAGSVLLGLWAAAGMAADEKAASRTEGKPLRVLLIGNSYSCAPLFDVVSGMAKAAGERPLDYTWVGGGGWLLQWQWETPAEYLKRPDFNGVNKSLKALREGTWDIVVLQGYSDALQDPPANFLKYGKLLAAEAQRKKARVILYQTWPTVWKEMDKPHPDVLAKLERAYAALAKETGGTVSPAGTAFEAVKTQKPEMGKSLHYMGIDEHPHGNGVYLIACVHFATIYGRTPVGLPEKVMIPPMNGSPAQLFGTDKDTALVLQKIAWEAVQRANPSLSPSGNRVAAPAPR